MTNAELLKKIKRAKGKIYGALLGGCDTHHIQLVRKDLIQYVSEMEQDQQADFDITTTAGTNWIDSY